MDTEECETNIDSSLFLPSFISLLFTFPKLGLSPLPPGLTTQILVDQMPVGGATDCGPEH